MLSFLTKVFGSKNEREVKRMQPAVDRINALEPAMKAMTDEELRTQTGRFRERVANGEPLDDLLPEAFAAVREASVRSLKMRHFDVQLIGGMVLHEGQHRRDEDRRGQDPGRDAAGLSERAGRAGRARRHGQRLPRPARHRVDGQYLPVPGPVGGHDRARADRCRAAEGLRGRHHLRHQQRVRVRLPARQHEVRPRRASCSASSTTRSSTRWTAS